MHIPCPRTIFDGKSCGGICYLIGRLDGHSFKVESFSVSFSLAVQLLKPKKLVQNKENISTNIYVILMKIISSKRRIKMQHLSTGLNSNKVI